MESKHSLRKSKLFRALLILLLIAVPVQWAAAQLTLSTPRTTLGTVIKQIQSQSKYQNQKRWCRCCVMKTLSRLV